MQSKIQAQKQNNGPQLTNRVIRCEISKTIQEVQFEPLKVAFTMEGVVADGDDILQAAEELRDFVAEQVTIQITRSLT